jgi:hypothetical protein
VHRVIVDVIKVKIMRNHSRLGCSPKSVKDINSKRDERTEGGGHVKRQAQAQASPEAPEA